jgi:hypothetical protein
MQGQTYKNYYFKINKKILQKLNTKQNIKKIVNSQKACKSITDNTRNRNTYETE